LVAEIFRTLPRPSPSQKDPNYLKEAFHIQYNMIALAGAAALSLVGWTALPTVAGGRSGNDVPGHCPQNWRFQRLVRSWKFAAEQKLHESKLRRHAAQPARRTCRAATSSWPRSAVLSAIILPKLSSASQMFVQQMDTRLEGLLHGYVRLLTAAVQQRTYVKGTDPELIKKEIVNLQQETGPRSASCPGHQQEAH